MRATAAKPLNAWTSICWIGLLASDMLICAFWPLKAHASTRLMLLLDRSLTKSKHGVRHSVKKVGCRTRGALFFAHIHASARCASREPLATVWIWFEGAYLNIPTLSGKKIIGRRKKKREETNFKATIKRETGRDLQIHEAGQVKESLGIDAGEIVVLHYPGLV
jgi:hypothetical protein